MKKSEGFTLIEILVVIAIIGSLSALLLPNYMEARMRARDAQRKSDLKMIQSAIEMYKTDSFSNSPNAIPNVGVGFTNSSGNVYVKKMPGDPTTAIEYEYVKNGAVDYTLCTCLENIGDKEGLVGDCPGAILKCQTSHLGLSYQLAAP
jgi:general secretion pathway protein G